MSLSTQNLSLAGPDFFPRESNNTCRTRVLTRQPVQYPGQRGWLAADLHSALAHRPRYPARKTVSAHPPTRSNSPYPAPRCLAHPPTRCSLSVECKRSLLPFCLSLSLSPSCPLDSAVKNRRWRTVKTRVASQQRVRWAVNLLRFSASGIHSGIFSLLILLFFRFYFFFFLFYFSFLFLFIFFFLVFLLLLLQFPLFLLLLLLLLPPSSVSPSSPAPPYFPTAPPSSFIASPFFLLLHLLLPLILLSLSPVFPFSFNTLLSFSFLSSL